MAKFFKRLTKMSFGDSLDAVLGQLNHTSSVNGNVVVGELMEEVLKAKELLKNEKLTVKGIDKGISRVQTALSKLNEFGMVNASNNIKDGTHDKVLEVCKHGQQIVDELNERKLILTQANFNSGRSSYGMDDIFQSQNYNPGEYYKKKGRKWYERNGVKVEL